MKFDTSKYKIWTWKHPMNLHWILNPGLFINELILGQRMPKVILIEKDVRKSLPEKSHIPCPHCHTIHSSLKWTPQNKTAFGNWFGLYCDNCGGIIPCLRNLTSLILLIATFPVWIWFRNRAKQKWLETQRKKFANPIKLTMPEYNWLTQGLSWGFFMFVFMELFLSPLIDGEGYNMLKLGLGLVLWLLSGLVFGYMMKLFMYKQTQKKLSNSSDR